MNVSVKVQRRAPIELGRPVVMESFRNAVFDAARRRGMAPSEMAALIVGSYLAAAGADIDGVFAPGDMRKFL